MTVSESPMLPILIARLSQYRQPKSLSTAPHQTALIRGKPSEVLSFMVGKYITKLPRRSESKPHSLFWTDGALCFFQLFRLLWGQLEDTLLKNSSIKEDDRAPNPVLRVNRGWTYCIKINIQNKPTPSKVLIRNFPVFVKNIGKI